MKRRLLINIFATTILAAAILLTGCAEETNDGIEKYNNKDYQGALEYFENQVDSNKASALDYAYLGITQSTLKNYNDAKKSFEQALAMDENCAEALRGKGVMLYNQGKIDEAMPYLETAYSVQGDEYADTRRDAKYYYALCQYAKDDYIGAINTFTELIEYATDKQKASLFYYRGCVYIDNKQENEAVMDFEESLKINSEDYAIYFNMYTKFVDGGYQERGESYLRRLLNTDETDDILAGKTYYHLKDYNSAKTHLEKAYSEDKTEAAYYLCLTYQAMGNYTDAQNLYEAFMDKFPQDAVIRNQYAAYLISKEKYDDALRVILKTLDFTDDTVSMQGLLFNEAVCYEKTGDFDKALELFTEYLEKYPNDIAALKEYDFLRTR